MSRIAALALLCACATASPREKPLRVKANHYQSMSGITFQSGDSRDSQMTCNRDYITGSHILQWYCRFDDSGMQYLLNRPVQLVLHSPEAE